MMQLSKRKSRIVSELLKSNNYLTSQYLANILGVSSRTVRNDMKELNDIFFDMGISIHSITGKGYGFFQSDKKKISDFVDLNEGYSIPVLPESRVDHIIKQLMFHPEGITIHNIATQLYVSESTLSRDLVVVQRYLGDKGLRLKTKSRIMTVKGDEHTIREMYFKYLRGVDTKNIDFDKQFKSILIKLNRLIKTHLVSKKSNISNNEFEAIVKFVGIVIYRIKKGFSLSDNSEETDNADQQINDLVDAINRIVKLNNSEKQEIIKFLKRILNKNQQDDISIKNHIKDALEEIESTFDYHFSTEISKVLEEILNERFRTYQNKQDLEDIKREYPLAFEMAVTFGDHIQSKGDVHLDDALLKKFVLAFACDMETDMFEQENKKRNIVVITKSGQLSNNFIEIRLKRFFSAFQVIGFYPLYMLKEALSNSPDFVISTQMVETNGVPIIVIDPLFKDYDILKIKTVIRQLEHRESNSYDFLNIFKENLFVKGIEAKNKYDAINQLFNLLKQNNHADDQFLEAVLDRESISSTHLGNLVAVPHAIGKNMGENVVAIGISKQPIDWDGNRVQLIFLINIQNATEGNVKQIFNSFFDVISSYGKVEHLIKSKNYYEFIKTLNQ